MGGPRDVQPTIPVHSLDELGITRAVEADVAEGQAASGREGRSPGPLAWMVLDYWACLPRENPAHAMSLYMGTFRNPSHHDASMMPPQRLPTANPHNLISGQDWYPFYHQQDGGVAEPRRHFVGNT
eukprot:jgi/Mesvir1/20665/Mv14879-RA.1